MDRGAWKIIVHGVAKSPDMTERLSPSLPLLLLPRGGTSGKEAASQCSRGGRGRFHPWVGKIPWRRKRQPTLVLLSGKSHGQRSLVDYSP